MLSSVLFPILTDWQGFSPLSNCSFTFLTTHPDFRTHSLHRTLFSLAQLTHFFSSNSHSSNTILLCEAATLTQPVCVLTLAPPSLLSFSTILLCGAATPTEPVCVLTHPPPSRQTLDCGTAPGWFVLSSATLTSVALLRVTWQ